MKKFFYVFLIISIILIIGCSNSNDARNALSNAGMTHVIVTGYSPFACGDDDFYSTGFTAINPQGNQVSGTVCSGFLFKSSTIRW